MLDTNLDTAKRKSIPYSVLRINTHSIRNKNYVNTYVYLRICMSIL